MRITKTRLVQLIREEVEAASGIQGIDLDSPDGAEQEEEEESPPPAIDDRREKMKFKKSFLSTYSDFKSMSPRPTNQPKEVRVGPVSPSIKVTPEIAKKLIQDLGYEIQQEILPGAPGAKTGKGTTYVVAATSDSAPFSVVFGSANKGESFEAALRDDLQTGSGPLGDELLSALSLTRADVLGIDPPLPARGRPLTGEIRDDGKAISDITIHTLKDGSPSQLYISLKDPTGGTFANNGVAGMFVEDENGIVSPADHNLDNFIHAMGIDKQRVAQGVNDYKMMKSSSAAHCKTEAPEAFDPETIANYLASALGYGYVYARKKTTGGYHVEHINTADDARALVGLPVSIRIIYARYCNDGSSKSKGTRAIIDTDNGARYDVAIRNKSGRVTPKELGISIIRYPSKSIHETRLRWVLQEFARY